MFKFFPKTIKAFQIRAFLGLSTIFLSAMIVFISGQAFAAQYCVSFEGIEDSGLVAELREVAKTVDLKDRVPPSSFLLSQRARKDIPRLREVLKAKGYYQASIEVEVREKEEQPLGVIFKISLGPEYKVKTVKINTLPQKLSTKIDYPSPEDLDLEPGKTAKAEDIRAAGKKLEKKVIDQGYVLAQVKAPLVLVDHHDHSLKITYEVRPGPRARYGQTEIQGLSQVKPVFVQKRIPWKEGQVYDPREILDFKEQMMETELFSLIQVEHGSELNDQGRLPITVKLKERKHRIISLGIGYETDRGPRLSGSWEHSNLLGQGERFQVETELSEMLQELSGRYQEPSFWRSNQSLLIKASLRREDTEAYTSRVIESSANIERQLSNSLSLGTGLQYKGSLLDDAEGSEHFHIFSLPSFLDWDTRDDLLNPSKGQKIHFQLTPFQRFAQSGRKFARSTIRGRYYKEIISSSELIAAFRGKVGSLFGASTEDIPADERFYAGGGGSIRGYPYQEVGPREDDDPFGGRFLIEVSSELRWKMTERIGAVVFLDGGDVYDDPLPEDGISLSWGTGVGLRYYSGVGPLRIDVGFPLNRDEDHHEAFQVYISLGQAF